MSKMMTRNKMKMVTRRNEKDKADGASRGSGEEELALALVPLGSVTGSTESVNSPKEGFLGDGKRKHRRTTRPP
jgi:hypothetical protein